MVGEGSECKYALLYIEYQRVSGYLAPISYQPLNQLPQQYYSKYCLKIYIHIAPISYRLLGYRRL